MDPNPNNFPILSYVMKKIPSIKRANPTTADDYDIEQPRSPAAASSSYEPHFELTEQMPHLKDPKLISEMRLAVADVAQTRSMLRSLGERPDHESVDNARLKLSEVEANLSRELDEIVLSPGDEVKEGREDRVRAALEREKEMYKSVISLDEMHEAYEKMLKEAEDRLQKIYDAAVAGADLTVLEEKEEEVVEEEVNEEVVAILKQAESNGGIERVDLSGRQLRLLPEAFGKIKSLVVLDLSNNQLVEIKFIALLLGGLIVATELVLIGDGAGHLFLHSLARRPISYFFNRKGPELIT